MSLLPKNQLRDYTLVRCQQAHAGAVASWVDSADELFWLAPGTPPPLTPDKVMSWTTTRDNPFVLMPTDQGHVLGYAELNPMPNSASDYWIGHLIVPRSGRGRGLGFALTVKLLTHAFADLQARRVNLVVFPENTAAINCYLKAGMRRSGTQIRSFDHVDGRFKMLRFTITLRQFEHTKLKCQW